MKDLLQKIIDATAAQRAARREEYAARQRQCEAQKQLLDTVKKLWQAGDMREGQSWQYNNHVIILGSEELLNVQVVTPVVVAEKE